jgi:enamine deaminase RidA (YjgF/YER057c/UK114 family)
MRHDPFNPEGLPVSPRMSWAVRAGRTVYLSGHVALDGDRVVGEGDPLEQARHIFKNLERSLSAAGATFEDVVKLTCYALSPEAYQGYAAVKKDYVAEAGPAGTAIIVKALLDPRLLLEVEAIAVLDQTP